MLAGTTYRPSLPHPQARSRVSQSTEAELSILTELQRARSIFATCPECREDFRLSQARLFDATRRLPECARAYLADQQAEITAEHRDLRDRAREARDRSGVLAEAVNIGTAVENIALSLPGFPVASRDCRSLFKPIDYVVFNGLSATGRVDSVAFIDVKSGNGRLKPVQSQIRSLVEAGKVRLLIADPAVAPCP